MNKEKANQIVEAYDRILFLQQILKCENEALQIQLKLGFNEGVIRVMSDMECTNRALQRIRRIINILSGKEAIQCKILELDMMLDKCTSQNEEIQLKAKLQILREL
jgi:hypothetical protein